MVTPLRGGHGRWRTSTPGRGLVPGPVAVLAFVMAVALSGCTDDATGPEPSGSPSAAGSATTTSSAAGVSTPALTTPSLSAPETQAAADAEAAYRRYIVESTRFTTTAIRQAQNGQVAITDELQAILRDVAVAEDFASTLSEPMQTLGVYPDAADIIGSPEVVQVVVDTVELYDPPRTVTSVDISRENVTGEVSLRACLDASTVRVVGADGAPLDGDPGTRILTETVTASLQPHPDTGVVAWYVAYITNTVGETCEL